MLPSDLRSDPKQPEIRPSQSKYTRARPRLASDCPLSHARRCLRVICCELRAKTWFVWDGGVLGLVLPRGGIGGEDGEVAHPS